MVNGFLQHCFLGSHALRNESDIPLNLSPTFKSVYHHQLLVNGMHTEGFHLSQENVTNYANYLYEDRI